MINSQKQTLLDLSQDLQRVAMGRHRDQVKMSETFVKEVQDRLTEIGDFKYRDRILAALSSKGKDGNEDLLMYSVLTRNYSQTL